METSDTVAAFSENLMKSQTVEDAWMNLTWAISVHGFDRMMFGLNSLRSDGQPESVVDALILFHGEQAYVDRYLDEGHYYSSPLINWARNNRGALSWLEAVTILEPQPLTSDRIRFQKLLADFKLFAGYFISLADVDSNSLSVLSLSAREGLTQADADAIWAQHGRNIELMAQLFYLRVRSLPQPGQSRPLTTRQKETLRWIGAGKTAREIAQIMGLTPVTVEKHLQRAREALNVVSTAQAILKATRLNLL